MSVHRRLRRLEQHARVVAGARPCPTCGGPTDWRGWKPEPGEIEVRLLQPDEDAGVPDVCPACGRTLVIRLQHDRAG